MASDFGLKIGLEGEREFKAALKEINQQMKLLGSEMKLVQSQFGKNEKSVSSLTAQNKVLTKQIEEQKTKIEMLRTAMQNAAESFGENDRRTKQWAIQLNNAEAELNDLEKELKENDKALEDLEEGFDDAEKEADEFGDEVKESGEISDKTGEKFQGLLVKSQLIADGIAGAAKAIGRAIVDVAKAINECTQIYADFDDSMRQVAATMGMTAEEIENGSEDYEMLTKAAKEAGATTRYTASQAAEALNYLALAGYDAKTACAVLPDVLNLAAAGNLDLAYACDLATDAMSALQMDTSELSLFIDQMARTSQTSNTSVQQLGEAILVCAGTVKMTGQELTTMNTSLGVLANNGIKGAEGGTKLRNVLLSLSTPTDQAKKKLDDLGVSVYDAQGNMRQLDEILADLQTSLDSLSQEEATGAINEIFNKTDIAAVNALLASTGDQFDTLADKIENSKGAAANMAAALESGLGGVQREMESDKEGMQIAIGEAFSGAKGNIMRDLTEIYNAVTSTLEGAGGGIAGLGDALGTAISGFLDMFLGLLPEATSMIVTIVEAIVENLPMLVDAACQMIIAIAEGLRESLPELIPVIVEALLLVVQTLVENAPLLLEAGVAICEGILLGIINSIPTLIENLPMVIMSIIEFISSQKGLFTKIGIDLLEAIIVGILNMIPNALAAIGNLVSGILQRLGILPGEGHSVGLGLIEGIWQGFLSKVATVMANIAQKAREIAQAIRNALHVHSPSDLTVSDGKNLAVGLGVGFLGAIEGVKRDIRNALPTDFGVELSNAVAVPQTAKAAVTPQRIVQHTGTIRVEGVNDEGVLNGVVDIILDELRTEVRAYGTA